MSTPYHEMLVGVEACHLYKEDVFNWKRKESNRSRMLYRFYYERYVSGILCYNEPNSQLRE